MALEQLGDAEVLDPFVAEEELLRPVSVAAVDRPVGVSDEVQQPRPDDARYEQDRTEAADAEVRDLSVDVGRVTAHVAIQVPDLSNVHSTQCHRSRPSRSPRHGRPTGGVTLDERWGSCARTVKPGCARHHADHLGFNATSTTPDSGVRTQPSILYREPSNDIPQHVPAMFGAVIVTRAIFDPDGTE